MRPPQKSLHWPGADGDNQMARQMLGTPEKTDWAFSGHEAGQAFFGRFAPYFDRDCLRSLTPCRSNEPRTM